jgi:hypothetical protein
MADESYPEFFDFISASFPPTEGPNFQANLHEDVFRIHHVAAFSTPQFISFFPRFVLQANCRNPDFSSRTPIAGENLTGADAPQSLFGLPFLQKAAASPGEIKKKRNPGVSPLYCFFCCPIKK